VHVTIIPLRAHLPFVAVAVEARLAMSVPLVSGTAACGFPSPADDYLDRPLDFNELLIENAPATFAVKVAGESMAGVGLFAGDIAVVNRAKTAVDGSIVVALVDGEFTLKRFRQRRGRVWLHPENPAYPDIEITEGMSFEVWGVVTRSIRMLT
jgi:DNA polymerase V